MLNDMRKSCFALLLASLLILTSMSDCRKENFLGSTDYRPFSALVDGILYFSGEEYIRRNETPYVIGTSDDGFTVSMYRITYADEGKWCWFMLTLKLSGQFSVGSEFLFNSSETDNLGCVELMDGQSRVKYRVADGKIKFTGKEGTHYFGEFEIRAIDKNAGNEIRVSEGRFENIPFEVRKK